jgi:hypothetical protein
VAKEFNPGDSAFTVDGQAVTFIAKVGDGFCVRPIYEDEDGEPYEDGTPIITSRLYTEPPTEQRNQQIAELDTKIQAKREELQELQVAVRVTEGEMRSRKALITQHKGLERLEDFLEGRITHFVSKSYGPPQIREFKEAVETPNEDRYASVCPLRLLSLFGGSKGDLQWKLNHYSDGSGSYTDVYPCCSLEEAKAQAKEIMDAEFAKVRETGRGLNYWDEYQKAAMAAGVEIPADIVAINIKETLENAQTNLSKAEAEVQKWTGRIETLTPQATA